MGKTYLKNISPDGAYSNQEFKTRLMILPNQPSRKTGLCKIYLEVTTKPIRQFKRIDTKYECVPKEWSKAKEEVKPSNQQYLHINQKIKDFKLRVEGYLANVGDIGYLKDVESELKDFESRFNFKKRKTLLDFFQDYIKERLTNSPYTTVKEYITTKGRLERYQQARGMTLYFESFTFKFAEDLKLWCKEVGLDPNSASKTFDNIVTFCNHYVNDQATNNIYIPNDYTFDKFKKIIGTHDSEPSPLYVDELLKIINLDVSTGLKAKAIKKRKDKKTGETVQVPIAVNGSTAEKIKKLFLLGCYTGIRFSDLLRLSKGNIQNGDTIVLRAKKVDKTNVPTLYIPLIAPAKVILESINYDMSKLKMANQNANIYLTALLKDAGIDNLMKQYKYSLDGTRTETDKKKCEIVTFHSSRDTFITNCLISGANHLQVMQWSGHKKFDTFKKYVALSENYKKTQHNLVFKYFEFASIISTGSIVR